MAELSKPFNLGIVGCGAVTEHYYLPALKQLQQLGIIHVSAIVDPSAQRAGQIADSFPGSISTDTLDLVTAANTQLAIIASPNSFHAQQAIDLLEKHIAVLVEKPMAITINSAQTMLKLAEKNQQLLAVSLIRRFFPACQSVKDILESGVLGKPKKFRFAEGGPFQWALKSAALFNPDTAGGGILMDIGPHALDLSIWWFGEPENIKYSDDAMGGLEANCQINLQYPNGMAGEIRLSRDWQLSNKYEIECQHGWLSWTVGQTNQIDFGLNTSQFAFSSRLHEQAGDKSLGPPASDFGRSFINQLLNVINAVAGDEKLLVPAQEAMRSMKLIDSCYRQRKLMTMPWLSEQELERATALNQRSSAC